MNWLSWTFAAFIFAILGQALLLRGGVLRNSLIAFVTTGAPFGFALMAVLLPGHSISQALAGILLYAFLCEFWIFVFSSIFSSISATLMLNLRAGAMCRHKIDRLFDNRQMIRRRISWLRHVGAAIEKNDVLTPSEKGRHLLRLFDALRAFFGHR
jgi:hypothetical protein